MTWIRPTSWCSSTSRRRATDARSCSTPSGEPPIACSSRSPSAAVSGASRTSTCCFAPERTRSRSTRRRSRTPTLVDAMPRTDSDASVSSSPSTRGEPRSVTRCIRTVAAGTPGDTAVDWAREVAARGAGEILLTSMDQDGTKDGYDLALTASVVAAVDIPVIASGGAGNPEHLRSVSARPAPPLRSPRPSFISTRIRSRRRSGTFAITAWMCACE